MKKSMFLKVMGLVLTTLLLTGCSEEPSFGIEEDPVAVVVVKVSQGVVEQERWVAGVIEPATRAVVSTRMTGRVTSIEVDSGDRVESGDLLVEIDSRDLESKIEAAKRQKESASVAWKQADRNLNRMRRLFEDDLIPLIDVEKAEIQEQEAARALAGAEAELTTLKVQMDYLVIKAPFPGVVADVLTELGSLVVPGPPLLILEDRSRLDVRAGIDEKSITEMNPGDPIDVYFPVVDRFASGIIEAFIPALEEPGSGSSIIVALEDPPDDLRPGMVAQIRASGFEEPKGVAIVPADAILTKGQLNGVFVIVGEGEETRIHLRWVHLHGPFPGKPESVAIQRGIDPGERVVIKPEVQTLRDNQPARIIDQR